MNRTMRKMRKMAQRHRPIARATNPFWQSQRCAEAPRDPARDIPTIAFKGIAVHFDPPRVEREQCLMHVPSCVRGDDGLWHEQGCPAVADDESDYEHLADAGECVCAAHERGQAKREGA